MPILTILIILANLVAYRLELNAGGMVACEAFGLISAQAEPSTFVTHLFLHNPESVFHLYGNMALLLVAGAVIERELGTVLLGGLFLLAGVAGGAMHVAVDLTSVTPLVGASGAIFGLLPLLGLLRPRTLGFVVCLVAFNVRQTLTGTGADVSVAAHVGGFAAGFLVALGLRVGGHEALSLEEVS